MFEIEENTQEKYIEEVIKNMLSIGNIYLKQDCIDLGVLLKNVWTSDESNFYVSIVSFTIVHVGGEFIDWRLILTEDNLTEFFSNPFVQECYESLANFATYINKRNLSDVTMNFFGFIAEEFILTYQ